MSKTIDTRWEAFTYDVWGNRTDGYDVNDKYCIGRDYRIDCKVQTFNLGTAQQFDSATPSDYQIKKAFGVRCAIETDGDDCIIYVSRASDSYPIGELRLVNYESLSPIRKEAEAIAA